MAIADTRTAPEDRSAVRRRFLESLTASGGRAPEERPSARIEEFGATHREHRALVESAGLLELTDRCLLRVEGPRTVQMLDGLLTNDAASAVPEGRAVYSFLLTSRGRPVADLRAVPVPPTDGAEDEAVWLDLPPGSVEEVEEHLTKYLPPRFAEHRREPGIFPLAVVGPEAGAVLSGVASGAEVEGLAPLETARIHLAGAEVLAVRREPVEGPGFDLYVQGPALRATWDALVPAVEARGGRPAGRRAWEILRVERGIPAFGAEITRDVLPQETGQEDRAISFEKGCYTGQEVVVRIQHRGHVNRHLRGLAFQDAPGALPEAGAELRHGDRSVGRLTTVVRSPRFGPVALGFVRREVEPGELVRVGAAGEGPEGGTGAEDGDGDAADETTGPAARVRELPFTRG